MVKTKSLTKNKRKKMPGTNRPANDFIRVRRARVHNLKNISLDIPKNKLVVITGVSGSGKSSLAFDTLYAEGQRRYVESLSAYARQFLGIMEKPDVDSIEGISPAISIDQRKASHNPRSTVGTITEIYDYLRLLFSRVGVPHCPECKKKISRQTIDQIVKQILNLPRSKTQENEITILGPLVRAKKGEHQGIMQEIQRAGFIRLRINGIVYRIEEALEKALEKNKKHNIEVVVDRLKLSKDLDKPRLVDSLETALKLGKGMVIVSNFQFPISKQISSSKFQNKKNETKEPVEISKSQPQLSVEDLIFSEHFACEECAVSLPELEPRLFSFNSPFGACPDCQGLGEKPEVSPSLVIPNENLTIAEGAIFPWTYASHKIGRQGYFWLQLQKLAQKYQFSLDAPIRELPQKIIEIILYGENQNKNLNHQSPSFLEGKNSVFEGVIPSLERRYRQTESDYTRREIGQYIVEKKCETCQGKRLKPEVLAITVAGRSIDKIVEMQIDKARDFFEKIRFQNLGPPKLVQPIIKEIVNRFQFLIDVGLNYITLDRKTATLSGGEEQRIRLATQIGSKLTGVLYILDEPSIGLHARDQKRLIKTLKKLRDLGNTVVLTEHDVQTILEADWIIDVGPGAGKNGGRIVFEGTPKQLLKSKTLTGDYLAGRKKVEIKNSKLQITSSKQITNDKSQTVNHLIVKGASEHNLKNIDVKIPLAYFVCITGVSGSGKSTFMNDILARALMKKFYRSKEEPGKHKEILGSEFLNKVALVDQSPIGRTPRSNPATYTGAFAHIRDLFSKTREARIRGYLPGRFSFNVKGGRCETCEGQGEKKIEMYFLPDIYVQCSECKGKRFNQETLSVEYRGKNIAEILEMTVEEALSFFKNIPGLYQKLKVLNDVGLSYLQLGQPAPSLSGGEAQRIKLSAELAKKATGKSLYILDEPTTGLHLDDIKKLIFILKSLVENQNTVLLTEHNLSVIKNADWVLDFGPEGGDKGGEIVAQGIPQDIAKNRKSYTGKFLREVFSGKTL